MNEKLFPCVFVFYFHAFHAEPVADMNVSSHFFAISRSVHHVLYIAVVAGIAFWQSLPNVRIHFI